MSGLERASTGSTPFAPRFIPALPTNEPLEYADLAIVDFTKAATSEGRAILAAEVRDAMMQHGFFYVINHGYTPEQTSRIFDIGDVPFSQVSEVEKPEYDSKMSEMGRFQGYKPRQHFHIANGVRDQVEIYSLSRNPSSHNHPMAVRPFLPELEAFARHNHLNILFPVLRLLSLGLELPEDALVNLHEYKSSNISYPRFQKYYPRTEEDEEKTNQTWLKGHSDIGSITILWSQPVAGLQIRTRQGQWKWVKHMDNAVVINAGDAMEALSGGFYRGTIHRVVQPPPDQRGFPRLGAFYFAMPDEDTKLVPLMESPVLQRHGAMRRFEDDVAPTMHAWRKARTATYGQHDLKQSTEKGIEVEVVDGVVIKHYN